MSTTTAKYGIQYAQVADTVASVAATMAQLAGRVDLLLGEAGQFNIASLAAGTTGNQAIALARVYPGNLALTPPGSVQLQLPGSLGSANPWTWWIDTWTGTSTTITGFTLHYQFAAAQTNRLVAWRFLPVL